MPLSETAVPRLAEHAGTRVSDRDGMVDLALLAAGTALGVSRDALKGRSVILATSTQRVAAIGMVELDGLVGRMVIAPPDLKPGMLRAIVEDAGIEAIVTDEPERFADSAVPLVANLVQPIVETLAPTRDVDTEWVLLTSGTSGRPKMVAHTLAALTGAIDPTASKNGPLIWATFYDIRRYGGLQIFLRAVLGGTDLVLTSEGEAIVDHLRRLGVAGVTSISGTPSHWRRVLMSHERGAFVPAYVRLSGEIADQIVLDGLRAAYPDAAIGHAYASTEAGVGFAVDDGREGFPASLVGRTGDALAMKVEDGSLRIKSKRAASRYLGEAAPALVDAGGFVDTGDLVELRGDRYYFVGRRGGIINVGGLKVNPEEVEATINTHGAVRMSLVQAKKNPLTGAIVVAEIVLREPDAGNDTLKREILDLCRASLDRHKVPAIVRFVPHLALTPAGKLSRAVG